MIESYWTWIGGPWSVWVGTLTDLVKFPLSELILWAGIFSLVLLCICPWNPPLWHRGKYALCFGLICLIIQGFSQGATSWDFVPTVFRDPISSRTKKVTVLEEHYQKLWEKLWQRWWQNQQQHLLQWPEDIYHKAAPEPDLAIVNQALDRVLSKLKYPKGRHVKRWKNMTGITKILGLAYGGPAYHDVVSAEVVIASEQDLPSSKAWRWCTLIHEVAHAKGFTREMDAECLTWLALGELDHPMGTYLQSWMALGKTGQKIKLPAFLLEEQKQIWEARKALYQPMVSALKSLAKKFSIQNSGQKYGAIPSGTTPNADHEFFSMVLAEQLLN